MKRLIWFTIKLALIIALAMWFIEHSGRARIVWHGYIIDTSSAFLALCILVIGFCLYVFDRLWYVVRNGRGILRLRRKIHSLNEGHRHLTHGLVAVAAGHAAEAGRRAVGARKALGVTPATQLLHAQSAQLAGDHKMAKEIFLSLASDPECAVLGYRGLIMEAMRARDWEEAGHLTEKLRRLRPETPWLNLIRFELATRLHQWKEADSALTQIVASRLMDPLRAKIHQAATHLAASEDHARSGHSHEALQTAERAVRLTPKWTPALLILAHRQSEADHKRAMRRTIERAWSEQPHPHFAELYRTHGTTDPLKAYKLMVHLCRGQEDHPVSHMALAEAALAADLWGEARRHLLALDTHGGATQSTYRLLMKLERSETGNERLAMQWLSKALDASLDAVWHCQSCDGTQEQWHATCRHCGAFNSLEWHTPGHSRVRETASPVLLGTSWDA